MSEVSVITPRLLDETDVDALTTVPLALEAARETAAIVAAGGLTTSRVQVGDEATWARILVGILPPLDLFGYKEFHRVGQRVRYHIHLFSRSSADHLGTVDGRRITSVRTAATAALALAHHAPRRSQPIRVGVIGSGEEAKEGLRMVAGTLAAGPVRVFSPTPANREAYAAELGTELGLDITPVASADDALDGTEIAYIATSAAGEPFIAADQVMHLKVLAAIGSTHRSQRELVGDVFAKAGHVVVDCVDARSEPGDVIDAIENFGFDAANAPLLGHDLNNVPGSNSEPVLFKSIGSVEQDLVLALHLLRAAEAEGRGSEIAPVGSLRIMR